FRKPFVRATFVEQASPGKPGRRKFRPFYVVISNKLHNFASINISLTERNSLLHNILSCFSFSPSTDRNCLSDLRLRPLPFILHLPMIAIG
ncbi:MAG: hypothetical protein K2I32_08015, partial [Alistipes sp.]|nr:hypothetical protein [Alistipes sp.]